MQHRDGDAAERARNETGRAAVLPGVVLVLTLGLWAWGLFPGWLYAFIDASLVETLGITGGFLAFTTVGMVVAVRRPGHRVGWLFLAIGLLAALGMAATAYAHYALLVRPGGAPLANLAAWAQSWSWMGLLGMFAFVFLLFPDGRPPTPRWRWVAWAGVGVIVSFAVIAALRPRYGIGQTDWDLSVPNPLGLHGADAALDRAEVVTFAAFVAIMVLSVASVVVRFRRSRGTERAQLQWFAYGAVFAIVLAFTLDLLPASAATDWAGLPIFWVVPTTAGLAILRYRLYEIDRIVSRTLSYVLLTALLGGVYVLGVVVLGGALRGATGGRGGDLVVAATTLLVAALFQPLRRRLQSLVDLRFDRQHYDAVRAVAGFGSSIRHAVDLPSLEHELAGMVDRVLRPRQVAVWVAPRHTGG